MAVLYFPKTFNINWSSDERTLTEETLPQALRDTSSLTRVLCFLALGRPDLEGHWEALQSEDAFEIVRGRLCTILTNTITAWRFRNHKLTCAISRLHLTCPLFLLFISLMLAMIAMLISGLSMIRWLHTDRQWTREQLIPGGYFLLSYLLSIIMPMFFVGLSLNCFIFAMLIAGFYSQNTVCYTLTAVWLVIYVYAKSLKLR
ncbi:uncharacterized protein EDB91DRAFT_1190842 [Suillus paluster]|uniref:uncharacterized protein n=1 Tax=Suillus paluster TaxID=48578 RepID=UPI001B884288|nr:uncharacterized protein EDB91DRAFT_1190842 [Suillus paluster]KAG1717510.1 hypothetical protein EDB91DRAFT_1190842 [Suillus paluster]